MNSSSDVRAFYTKSGTRIGVELPGNTSAPEGTDGIEVVATSAFPTYFMGVKGVARSQAQGVAAARATMPTTSSGGGGAAVFAGNTNRDDAIKTTGPKYTIKGTVHSNSGITNSGGGYVVTGEVEYVTTQSADKWTINSSTNAPVRSTVQPYPVSYKIEDFAPGGSEAIKAGALYRVIDGDFTLKDYVAQGPYYVRGNVKASSKFAAEKVTLVSQGTIDISLHRNLI